MKASKYSTASLVGIASVIVLLTAPGCDALNPVIILPTITVPVPYTPRPTLPPTSTPHPGQALYTDSFEDPNSGWEIGEYDTGTYRYVDGYYSILAKGKNLMEWVLAGKSIRDAAVEVDVLPVYLPKQNNNAFGILCRAQEDGDGYAFRISGDGYYAIFRVEGDEFKPLVDWTESADIMVGGQANHLKAELKGPEMSFSINGNLVSKVGDSVFRQGDIGLIATTYEDDPTEIYFDNLKVTQP